MITDDNAVVTVEQLSAIEDLLEEVGSKNHVQVIKWEAKDNNGRLTHERIDDILSESITAHPAELIRQDKLRMLLGKKPIFLAEAYRRLGGDLRSITPNGRTTIGIDFCACALGGTTQPAVAKYIGLSNNTTATAVGDASSTLPWSSAQASDAAASTTTGEYTALGVARAAATYAHTAGTANYTMTYTWTATGTVTSLQKAGLFGGSTGNTQAGATATNNLFVTNTFTATSLANNDQLTLTWTINI